MRGLWGWEMGGRNLDSALPPINTKCGQCACVSPPLLLCPPPHPSCGCGLMHVFRMMCAHMHMWLGEGTPVCFYSQVMAVIGQRRNGVWLLWRQRGVG